MTSQLDTSWLIRLAIQAGATIGRWQRRLAARRDDALVEKWKAAWAEGSNAYSAGSPQGQVPYRRSMRRAAWLAGWQWAEQQAGRSPRRLDTIDSTGAVRHASARPQQEAPAATPVEAEGIQKDDVRF
jgi:hypothetical protein